MPDARTAVVVGSGPNGLAAAIALAQAGLSVTVLEAADEPGGGTRSAELTVPGLVHDVCSAVLPFTVASPFLRSLPLAEHGLRWRWPEVELAHPVDGGRAGVLLRSIDDTAHALGADGRRWARLVGPVVDRFDDVTAEIFQPLLHVPRHPITLTRFGLRALAPATMLVRRWETDEARGLFGGIAAHAFHPLSRATTGGIGVLLGASGHAVGWPVAAGGTQAVADALCSLLRALGGTIQTGVTVRSLDEVGPADVVMLDVTPSAAARIAGDRMPARVQAAYLRWRHGPAAFKLDLAVEGGVPWTNEACRRAGTVHVGGTIEDIALAERETHAGRMPARPFVLVGQQYLVDPSRSQGDVHPVWTYAHVPHGYDGDATEAILDQLERFAPGTRDRIVGRSHRSPADLEAENSNYVGGDIGSGANDARQVVLRPRATLHPYATGIPGVYLCSAATPPGAGVHGMGGANAAAAALQELGSR
jgi:phytoene dehydrogenase-like protein